MLIPQKLLSRVAEHFEGNMVKAKLWFEIDNPVLNGMKPKNYHQSGSWKRLEKMIDDALMETENERTEKSNGCTASV